MKNGEIAEEGVFSNLIKADGELCKILSKQSSNWFDLENSVCDKTVSESSMKSNTRKPTQIEKELIIKKGETLIENKYVLLFRTGGWLLIIATVLIYLLMSVNFIIRRINSTCNGSPLASLVKIKFDLLAFI
jgi:hypothetical protein